MSQSDQFPKHEGYHLAPFKVDSGKLTLFRGVNYHLKNHLKSKIMNIILCFFPLKAGLTFDSSFNS